MAVLNPEHLLAQAERLIEPRSPGPARQADIRRAISASYYGLFHFVAASAADEVIGAVHRNTLRYQLAYRSIDHKTLRALCVEVGKPTMTPRYRDCFPAGGPAVQLRTFANTFVKLQERRHSADYDPFGRRGIFEAGDAVAQARNAIARFREAELGQRRMFLALLLFPPR